jgi:succinate dehydrogenase/fumarate reductase iron-sulfur protein
VPDILVRVWRGGAEGHFQAFEVPRGESQTVLDVVTYIQRHLDPTLAYRFACRVGMCGSCAMTVNGRPRWTCRTHVDAVAGGGVLEVAPLQNLPVVRDLVSDLRGFFDKWARAKGQFMPTRSRADDFDTVPPASRERVEADAGIECIGCAVCYAPCDVVRGTRLPRARRAQPRVDAGERRARRRRASACERSPATRAAIVPHAHELHRALPEEPLAHARDRGPQARDLAARGSRGGRGERAPRGDALGRRSAPPPSMLAFCVLVHPGHDRSTRCAAASRGGDPRAHRGSIAWGTFYRCSCSPRGARRDRPARNVAPKWLRLRGDAARDRDDRRGARARPRGAARGGGGGGA